MSRFRYRDEDESSAGTVVAVLMGAVAGFAAGMFVAQRVGGFSGLTSKLRRAAGRGESAARSETEEYDEYEQFDDDEIEEGDVDASLEERVLTAFRNDPVLAERAIDIGSISDGVIELAGWVEDEAEAEHAVTIARGVPGVDTVVNRIALGEEERRFEQAAKRFRRGDSSATEARWEGRHVGTGRRRQGRSDELDRHADPRVDLEERLQRTDDALRNAADDVEGIAERRAGQKRPAADHNVPRGDHAAPDAG